VRNSPPLLRRNEAGGGADRPSWRRACTRRTSMAAHALDLVVPEVQPCRPTCPAARHRAGIEPWRPATASVRRRGPRRAAGPARRSAYDPVSRMRSSMMVPKGTRGSEALGPSHLQRGRRQRRDLGDALLGSLGVDGIALDADQRAPAAARGACRAGAERTGRARGRPDCCCEQIRLSRARASASDAPCDLRRPSAARAPSRSGKPVGAHLDVVVERLHGLVVKVTRDFGIAAGPDQRLVRIREPLAPEVRHRIGLRQTMSFWIQKP